MVDSKTMRVAADSPLLQPEGAWKVNDKDGASSYEAENVEKGASHIRVPIRVPKAGHYEVSVLWRKNPNNASNVLVEVFAPGNNTIAMTPTPSIPEKGEARFFIDCSEDSRPFAKLDVSFKFGAEDYVVINNKGTRARVTAGAIDFVHRDKGATFTVDSKEAEGSEAWKTYDAGRFAAYNRKGTPLQDENKAKGERHLRFKPSLKQGPEKAWDADRFYQVHIFWMLQLPQGAHAPRPATQFLERLESRDVRRFDSHRNRNALWAKDGTNYNAQTGDLKKDHDKHRDSFIPNHGDVYATALHLSDIDPKGRGRNERPPLTFIKKA